MTRGNRLAHFSVLLFVAGQILSFPNVVIPQASNADPAPHIVEPIITEETLPNEPGDWDLRFSGSYRWRGTEGSGFLPRTQLFFGIANRWGGEIEVPLAFAKGETNHCGVGDTSASVKYLIRKASVRMPGFVLGLETTFPTGNANSGLGEGVFEAAPFVATVYASRRAVLQGNVGYSIVHRISRTEASNELFYNIAAALPIVRLNSFLLWEINGTHSPGRNRTAFSPGLKYNLTPDRFLALAFPFGLNSQTPRMGIVLQLQIALQSANQDNGRAK
jgi:Putative MetA-pathway of phenol degradation